MYYKVDVRFKNGANTGILCFSEDELLKYLDDTIGDDYLYDQVFDWLDTPKIGGEIFQKYPITIFVVEDDKFGSPPAFRRKQGQKGNKMNEERKENQEKRENPFLKFIKENLQISVFILIFLLFGLAFASICQMCYGNGFNHGVETTVNIYDLARSSGIESGLE